MGEWDSDVQNKLWDGTHWHLESCHKAASCTALSGIRMKGDWPLYTILQTVIQNSPQTGVRIREQGSGEDGLHLRVVHRQLWGALLQQVRHRGPPQRHQVHNQKHSRMYCALRSGHCHTSLTCLTNWPWHLLVHQVRGGPPLPVHGLPLAPLLRLLLLLWPAVQLYFKGCKWVVM